MNGVKIAIIDYGVGNLKSLQGALLKVGAEPKVTKDAEKIGKSEGIVLPGVGAYRMAIENLNIENILDMIHSGVPILGICLGLQLLFKSSEEGGLIEGLGVLDGTVRMMPSYVKLPHMGWNTLDVIRDSPLLEGIKENAYFYFAHSFASFNIDSDYCSATTTYGVKFVSTVCKNNIFGTQFHPEKSGTEGLKVLENYVRIVKARV
ncbi:MAG: imidazole glycerol phosphate synthase subunit HisH [Thermoproteota archaeon]